MIMETQTKINENFKNIGVFDENDRYIQYFGQKLEEFEAKTSENHKQDLDKLTRAIAQRVHK